MKKLYCDKGVFRADKLHQSRRHDPDIPGKMAAHNRTETTQLDQIAKNSLETTRHAMKLSAIRRITRYFRAEVDDLGAMCAPHWMKLPRNAAPHRGVGRAKLLCFKTERAASGNLIKGTMWGWCIMPVKRHPEQICRYNVKAVFCGRVKSVCSLHTKLFRPGVN